MAIDRSPAHPTLPWRTTSSLVTGLSALLSRAFLFGASHVEVQGLEDFLRILDRRKDVDSRERGLLTGEYEHEISMHDRSLTIRDTVRV